MKLPPYKAVILDMDGVLTQTVRLHLAAWTQLFNPFLEQQKGKDYRPFTEEDYTRYVDGKPRLKGIRSFLKSRNLSLPEGSEGDPSEERTIQGLGKRKNQLFQQLLEKKGVTVYEDVLPMLAYWQERQLPMAVVTSSKNASQVLQAGGLAHYFQVQVDGLLAAELDLDGKPQADTFIEAARRLGHPPADCLLVEDARAGVEAGKKGSFGWVVGIARKPQQAAALKEAGADHVIQTLSELKP
ncbi:HAD family hydrolase [Cesiribacter andamanensis]|uniref:Beta-phosphoglucomutase n=1 Tax=Cesiribacter andamanensis AMV16 TaxID=1279009 RepID=M7NUZ4_9BACT|nr:beta-phosphoglucomutase family hydrolase [Cesiribacter andamanensis]EMR02259.1 putative glycosyl hydrolase [Cesiribacter andamanensis AMV16]